MTIAIRRIVSTCTTRINRFHDVDLSAAQPFCEGVGGSDILFHVEHPGDAGPRDIAILFHVEQHIAKTPSGPAPKVHRITFVAL